MCPRASSASSPPKTNKLNPPPAGPQRARGTVKMSFPNPAACGHPASAGQRRSAHGARARPRGASSAPGAGRAWRPGLVGLGALEPQFRVPALPRPARAGRVPPRGLWARQQTLCQPGARAQVPRPRVSLVILRPDCRSAERPVWTGKSPVARPPRSAREGKLRRVPAPALSWHFVCKGDPQHRV